MAGAAGEVRVPGRAVLALFFAAFLARVGMGPLFWVALTCDSRFVPALDFVACALEPGVNQCRGSACL